MSTLHLCPAPYATAPPKPPEPEPEKKERFFTDLGAVFRSVGRARDWFAEGAIEGNPLIVLSGPEKKNKSWAAMDLAVATITGGSWLGEFKIARRGPCFYCDGEYGEYDFARRVARICRGAGADPAAIMKTLGHLYSTKLTLKEGNGAFATLLAYAKKVRPALIIVDPFRNHLDGDENLVPIIIQAASRLSELRDAAGCPLMVLHHPNKAGTPSGSRSIQTRADLLITGTDAEEPVYTTTGRRIRARIDPIAVPFSISVEHQDDDDDSIAQTRVRRVVVDPSDLQIDGPSKLARMVLAFLRTQSEPRSANYIAKATQEKSGKSRSNGDVKDALEELRGDGLAECVPSGVVFNGRNHDGWRAVSTRREHQTSGHQTRHQTSGAPANDGDPESGMFDA